MASQAVDLVDHKCRHGQGGPISTIDTPAFVEANEIVPSLGVTSRPSSNTTNGTCIHAVVMLFMCLDILPEFHPAMSIKIDFSIKNDLRWILSSRNAVLDDKHIAPEELRVDQFHNEDWGNICNWKDIVLGSDLFLDSTVVSFNFGHMFISGHNIDNGTKVGNVASH